MIKGASALATAVSFASGAAVALLLSSALRARRGDASNDADNTASSKEHSRSSSDEQTQKEEEQVQRQLLHAEAEKHCWKIVEHSFTGAIIYVMDQLGLGRGGRKVQGQPGSQPFNARRGAQLRLLLPLVLVKCYIVRKGGGLGDHGPSYRSCPKVDEFCWI